MATKKKKLTPKKAAKKTAKKAAKKATKKAAKKATKKAAKTTKKASKKAAKTTKKTAKKAAKKTTKKAAKKTTKKAAKKTTKKLAKKAATKSTKKAAKTTKKPAAAQEASLMEPASVLGSASVRRAPRSSEAAATIIPHDDDALEGAMVEAFDSLFLQDPVPLPATTLSTPFEPGDPSEDLAQICAHIALDKKAEDVVILKVADLTSYADYFVIAAATSDRQAQAVARAISDELRARGRQPLSTDGLEQGNWVVIDYGSVVVHIFMQSARAYYDLDGFWSDAPRVDVDEARGKGALQHLGV